MLKANLQTSLAITSDVDTSLVAVGTSEVAQRTFDVATVVGGDGGDCQHSFAVLWKQILITWPNVPDLECKILQKKLW